MGQIFVIPKNKLSYVLGIHEQCLNYIQQAENEDCIWVGQLYPDGTIYINFNCRHLIVAKYPMDTTIYIATINTTISKFFTKKEEFGTLKDLLEKAENYETSNIPIDQIK